MKVGTDSDLLGTLAVGGIRILDVGTGTGVIALMMAQRFPEAQITALEIDDQAVIDAEANFSASPFARRIILHHTSFQDYVKAWPDSGCLPFDCVVCNPPYFDKSLMCPDLGRTRARHSLSLPFDVLSFGAFSLLQEGGVFSVCIPHEVLDEFTSQCLFAGFTQQAIYRIQSVPRKVQPKRYVLVFRKGSVAVPVTETHCMRCDDGSRSPWYRELMRDFLTI